MIDASSLEFMFCLELLLHSPKEQLCGRREDLVLLPRQPQPVHCGRTQRAECQPRVLRDIRQMIQAQSDTHALFDHHGGVEQQVVPADDVQPAGVKAFDH